MRGKAGISFASAGSVPPTDLFADAGIALAPSERHDPGGRRRLRMLPGMTGDAEFSACGRYRSVLRRSWDASLPTILWIGMNPSTATAEVDDPTIRAEIDFSTRWGYGRYLKANVMDYRATDPADLLAGEVVPRSPANLPAILGMATECQTVVLAFGALDRKLVRYGAETVAALEAAGVAMHHLVATAKGFPRHPLYVARTEPMKPYVVPAFLRDLAAFDAAA